MRSAKPIGSRARRSPLMGVGIGVATATLWAAHACKSEEPKSDPNGLGDASAIEVDAPACKPAQLYADDDHDGVGTGAAIEVQVCADGGPPGFASINGDCDDSDPQAFQLVYPDGDQDGYGSAKGTLCGGKSLPSKFVTFPGDCNDADPAVFPGAPEQWFDTLDSDCDGKDDPEDCTQQPEPCGCKEALGAPPSIAVDPSCQGKSDLFIANTIRCQRCGVPELIYVVIGNRGTVSSPVGATVALSVGGTKTLPVAINPPLPSGGASVPLMLESEAGKALIVIDVPVAMDCEPSNNSENLTVAKVDCR
jgi:hypothetical protein